MKKKTSKIAQAIPFPSIFVRSSASRPELWKPKMLFASDVTRSLSAGSLVGQETKAEARNGCKSGGNV